MISDLVALVSKYGWPVVLAAVLIFILVRGELRFRYPRGK